MTAHLPAPINPDASRQSLRAATGSVSCRFCGRTLRQRNKIARGYCGGWRCLAAMRKEKASNRKPRRAQRPKAPPVTDAELNAAYDAGFKCGMEPESTGDENPHNWVGKAEKMLRTQWAAGWTDGAEQYLAKRDAKGECERCMATPCMCAAVPHIRELLKTQNTQMCQPEGEKS